MMDSCINIDKFRQDINEAVNKAGKNLTIGMVLYIIKDVYNELSTVYEQIKQQEIQTEEKINENEIKE